MKVLKTSYLNVPFLIKSVKVILILNDGKDQSRRYGIQETKDLTQEKSRVEFQMPEGRSRG